LFLGRRLCQTGDAAMASAAGLFEIVPWRGRFVELMRVEPVPELMLKPALVILTPRLW
jgi:hypothetical protein